MSQIGTNLYNKESDIPNQYAYEVEKISLEAQQYLRNLKNGKEKTKNDIKNMALVFDIDETLISNYQILKAIYTDHTKFLHSLHNGEDFILKYSDKLKNEPLEPVQRLYNFALELGFSLFIITGNDENHRPFTIETLNRNGYSNWSKLYLKPSDYKEDTIRKFKTACRKEIEEEGYRIVLNLGDQYSDLLGGYSEKNFLLPNPFYFLP